MLVDGLAATDERNLFVVAEQRVTRGTRTEFDGGVAWFSTSWTYSPDDISARLHHARIYFACIRAHGQQPRYFYLARCSTRDDVDPLVTADVGFSGQRNATVALVETGSITGGLETTYAFEIGTSELQNARERGLAVSSRHASGTSYSLMYPAEFFRGFVAGTDGAIDYGTTKYRALAERLVGRGGSLSAPAPTSTLLRQREPSTSLTLRQILERPQLPDRPGTTFPLPRGVAENGSYFGEPNSQGRPKTVHVNGYFRRDGTYVRSHYRSSPRR